MKKTFEILDPINVEKWDECLLQASGASFFHTQGWAKVLRDSYGYRPRYFSLFEKGRLCLLIPLMEVDSFLTGRRGISLPFSDYCEPMIAPKDIPFQDIQCCLVEYGSRAGWKFIELRGGESHIPYPPYCYYYSHTLDISQCVDKTFSKFSGSTRRNVKKALRDGVEVDITNTPEAMKDFYRLNCLTRKKHGLPPQPFGFFENVYNHIVLKNHGLVVLASYQGQRIAGRIFLHFGKTVIDKYAVSDTRYQRLKPNNLLIWEAIKWYSNGGYESLSMGRTSPENEGLRSFKAGFGTEQKILKYYRYDLKKNQYIEKHKNSKQFHKKVFRMMPTFMSRAMGKVLYRHVG